MRRLTTIVLAGIMLTATLAYAGGDLIVDGKIGVGTTTPDQAIDVRSNIVMGRIPYPGNNLGTGWTRFVGLSDAAGVAPGGGAGMLLNAQTNGDVDIQFQTQQYGIANNYVTIKANGIVGIGTPNPQWGLLEIGTTPANLAGLRIHGPSSASGTAISIGGYGAFSIDAPGISGGRFVVTNSGNVGIGTASPVYTLDVQGQVASNGVALTSDAKFKKNLLPIATPLDKVLNLNGHSYEWKTDEYKEKNFPDGRHYGVIAQEIEKVLPEVVNTDAKGEKSVAYTEIIPVLIEAIKEQQKEIEELKRLLNAR